MVAYPSSALLRRLILGCLAFTGPAAAFVTTGDRGGGGTGVSSTTAAARRSATPVQVLSSSAATQQHGGGQEKESGSAPWVSLVSTDPDPLQALASLIQRAAAARTTTGSCGACATSFETTVAPTTENPPTKKKINDHQPYDTDKDDTVAFLFVGSYHAKAFTTLVAHASQTFPNLVSIVAGGVIGDGVEHDEPSVPSMALLTGSIPMKPGAGGRVRWFEFNEMNHAPPAPEDRFWKDTVDPSSSYLLFADPWSPLESVLSAMRGSSIVGGISVPTGPGSTIAINDRHLPQGSLVALEWPGEVVQVVVAQGCSPIGRPYTVTAVKGNTIGEMDGRPAVEVWNSVLQGIQSPSARSSVVCGIRIDRRDRRASAAAATATTKDSAIAESEDYLIRQVVGRTTTSGLVVAGRVRVGDTVRFHVRDASTARSDLHLMMSRAAAGRLWHAPPILAALQISCVARGRFLFGSSNIDIAETARLCGGGSTTAIGGFFANGELGPVGLSGFSGGRNESTETFLHGFTTVVALLCGARARDDDPDTARTPAATEQRIDAWG